MSNPIYKTFAVQRKTIDRDAGIYEAMISTEEVDRDGDVIRAAGIHIENYLRNPIVLAGHNYHDMDAVIARTLEMTKIPGWGVRARFQFAGAEVNPQAEMVRRLWDAEFLNATSIGFIPLKGKPMPNQRGNDFEEIELLEFSIVSVPSNQSALAIRAVKGLFNAQELREIGEQAAAATPEPNPDASGLAIPGRAWVRRAMVESARGMQSLFVSFYRFKVDVPEDAELMQIDPVLGSCAGVPHPDAGKTVWFRQAVFVPPLEFKAPWEEDWQEAVYAICERDVADEILIASPQNYWSVTELSEILAVLPAEKAWQPKAGVGYGINLVTRSSVERAKVLGRQLVKRGRVLSAKNEGKIRAARDNLNEVLAEVEEQPEIDEHAPRDNDKGDAWDGTMSRVARPMTMDEVLKPYPNEHACRLRDPNDFQSDSFRRVEREHEGKKYAVIMGRLKGEDTMTEQAYRYPTEDWTEAQARSHCRGHDGIAFEPASNESIEPMLEPGGQEKELLDGLQILTTLVKEVIT